MWVVLRPISTKREGDGSLFESKILVKCPKPRNKAQRKVDYKNYDAITMSRNYDIKLWGEIITGNYQLVYYDAENVGIIGILAYPKRWLLWLWGRTIIDRKPVHKWFFYEGFWVLLWDVEELTFLIKLLIFNHIFEVDKCI